MQRGKRDPRELTAWHFLDWISHKQEKKARLIDIIIWATQILQICKGLGFSFRV